MRGDKDYGMDHQPRWRERERIPMGNNISGRKLTDEEVLALRKEWKECGGKHGELKRLAKKYDISTSNCSNVVHRKTYLHLGGY